MARQNVLRSFLVSIGFDIDDQQWKKFDRFWTDTSQRMADLSVKAAAASLEITGAVAAISEELTDLFYTAQRAGTTAGGLRAFEFGAKQIGLTADQAAGAVIGLKDALRESPGLSGILKSWGINPNQDTTKTFEQIMKVTGKMPRYLGLQYAQMFGISKDVFMRYQLNPKAFQAGEEQQRHLAKNLGLNLDDLSDKSVEFSRQLNLIYENFNLLGMVLAKDFLPIVSRLLQAFTWLLDKLGPLDRATHGWSTRILAVVVALKALVSIPGIFRWLLGGTLARGGGLAAAGGTAAAAGEGAAIGEGATGGAGLLGGLISLPALAAVAAAAGLVWMMVHKDQVRSAAKAIWQDVKGVAGQVGAQAREAAHLAKAHPGGFLKAVADQALGALAGIPGISIDNLRDKVGGATAEVTKGLTTIVAGFEGLRKMPYRDLAGHLTIGYGHLIKRGENFAGGITDAVAQQMLGIDLARIRTGVMASLKRVVNSNQLNALTDLAFNIGLGAFNRSTLLRKLNLGDLAGAASEFTRWDKVRTKNGLVTNQGLLNRRLDDQRRFNAPITVTTKTDVHVTGTPDGAATAREVARQQNRVNGNMVRNLQGVIDAPGAF